MLKFSTPMNTRIAPSPTGNAHLGLVRTAYLNFLAAKSTGGKFLLRIDDTDSARSNITYTQDIINTLTWLGIDWDYDFSQSKRLDRYRDAAVDLINKKQAIVQDGAVILTPKTHIDSWDDLITGKKVITSNKLDSINQLVILRSDGTPTYHFASVIDDIDHNINLIIRGVDHIDNTAKHVYIYNALNAPLPIFAHVGLIFYKGNKLSKRDGMSNMKNFIDDSYCPDAILNAVLRLGWSHSGSNFDRDYPLIDTPTALSIFNQGFLKATSPNFSLDKLKWFDKKYKIRNNSTSIVK